MTSHATKAAIIALVLTKSNPNAAMFVVTGRNALSLRQEISLASDGDEEGFPAGTEVLLPALVAGTDYYITNSNGALIGDVADGLPGPNVIGGFHYAPGGNALARTGGDDIPAINPFSAWDRNFRPSCADPRGMALVDDEFWADIYLLGTGHLQTGTSRFGVPIADGRTLPLKADGTKERRLDYATSVSIYAEHGKQLLSVFEFFAAARGGTELTAMDDEPETTGLDAPRTSQRGLMQPFGAMWQWGHDGDPDNPRASVFGGSWLSGGSAGSRHASLGHWAVSSYGDIGARGRSDHLTLV